MTFQFHSCAIGGAPLSGFVRQLNHEEPEEE
jgi:hypothetical protein